MGWFRRNKVLLSLLSVIGAVCVFGSLVPVRSQPKAAMAAASEACPNDDSGLKLPAGFCATVFADGIGHARHLVAAANGVLYVNTWSGRYYGNTATHEGGFLVALQDKTRSGESGRKRTVWGDGGERRARRDGNRSLQRFYLCGEQRQDCAVRVDEWIDCAERCGGDGCFGIAAWRRSSHASFYYWQGWRIVRGRGKRDEFLPGEKPDAEIAGNQSLR